MCMSAAGILPSFALLSGANRRRALSAIDIMAAALGVDDLKDIAFQIAKSLAIIKVRPALHAVLLCARSVSL